MTTSISKPPAQQVPEARAAKQSQKKRLLLPAVQSGFYLLLCLGLLEAAFCLANVGENEYVVPDITVGYKPMPNKIMTQRREGFGHFKYNSYGMQNDELPLAKPPGVLRIAVLGDSYVESAQVDRKDNYMSTLGRDLSKKLGQKVEVLNFGVANYSVAQDYLRYQGLARRFQPDLVILGFRVEEVSKLLPEPTANIMSVRPVFFPGADGKPVYDNSCVKSFLLSKAGQRMQNTDWLRRNSRIWGIVGTMAQTLAAPPKSAAASTLAKTAANTAPSATASKPANLAADTGADAPADSIRAVRTKYTQTYWYIMDTVLRALHSACVADHSRLMILRTPSGSTNETETKLLRQSADKIGVFVLDLDQRHRQDFSPADDAKNFYANGHFTKPMHDWVAKQLKDYLTAAHPELLKPGDTSRSAVSK